MPKSKQPPPDEEPRRHRWGIFTLAFLILAFLMIVVSTNQGHYTVLTLIGLLVGLIGAGWCSVKGLQGLSGFRF